MGAKSAGQLACGARRPTEGGRRKTHPVLGETVLPVVEDELGEHAALEELEEAGVGAEACAGGRSGRGGGRRALGGGGRARGRGRRRLSRTALAAFALGLLVELLLPGAGFSRNAVDEVERRELVGGRGFFVVAVEGRDEARVALRVLRRVSEVPGRSARAGRTWMLWMAASTTPWRSEDESLPLLVTALTCRSKSCTQGVSVVH